MSRPVSPLVSAIPLVVLITLLAIVITQFGSDALAGGSQVALLMATALCIGISMWAYHVPWMRFEEQIKSTLGGVGATLIILLTVGMLAGSWMVSGVVPTMIYYGVQFMSPRFFLVSSCVICALVAVMSGSSWTTIATIGVALLGIGKALGVSEAWVAGAVISGSYFGDKMSPLSDTTILASSASRTDIFTHIRYMLYTTTPTITITLVIFLIAGFTFPSTDNLQVSQYTDGLSSTYNISLLTLIVPVVTAVLIARKVPSLITLFASSVLAGLFALILQPHLLAQIGDTPGAIPTAGNLFRGLAITYFGSTAVDTGNETLNQLVCTSGMAGMLNTIWLIICSMCFGGSMVASGMLHSITHVLVARVKSCLALVSSTVGTGLFLNLATGDQSISIILTADMYRGAYERNGFESRLLSRSTEDAVTVTSVLIPWNTCGMTQSTVLGVPTLTYLPFCFFNYLSPLMSVFIAAIGWKIRKKKTTSRSESTLNAIQL